MTDHLEIQNEIQNAAHAAPSSEKEGGSAVSRLALFAVDESAHSSDGLLLHGWDGSEKVTAFISRRVMDDWVDPQRSLKSRKSLFRAEYNDLGKRNLRAIESIATLNISAVLHSTGSTPSWTSCLLTLRKAAKCLTSAALPEFVGGWRRGAHLLFRK